MGLVLQVQHQGLSRYEIQLVESVEVRANLMERIPENPAQSARPQVPQVPNSPLGPLSCYQNGCPTISSHMASSLVVVALHSVVQLTLVAQRLRRYEVTYVVQTDETEVKIVKNGRSKNHPEQTGNTRLANGTTTF
ncbi:hypothetical protein Tco_0031999 [Tanacetum coccineum]